MSGVFYAPAFAALTRWYGNQAVGALTVLTLVAGLASTVFAPLTAALSTQMDWRTTYFILAGVLAAITIPAHALGLRRSWPRISSRHPVESPKPTPRSRPFIALTMAYALAACASYAVSVNLVPLMNQRGISTGAAAVALGLGGAGQVLGRLGYRAMSRRIRVVPRTVLAMASVAVTTVLIGIATSLAVVVAVAAAGMARAAMTLLQATAVTERWGTTHYGHLSGILSTPVMLTPAFGPFIGSALARLLGGYAAMFVLRARSSDAQRVTPPVMPGVGPPTRPPAPRCRREPGACVRFRRYRARTARRCPSSRSLCRVPGRRAPPAPG